MNSKTEQTGSAALDGFKWLVVVAAIATAAIGNAFYADYPLLYRAIGLVAVVGVAILVALTTVKGKAFSQLVKDSRAEVRKVVWPTRQETMQTTLVVLVVVFIAAILFFLMDMGLGKLITWLIG